VRPAAPGTADIEGKARANDDPAVLDQLLALPRAHLIIDGYNVTKTGYPTLSLHEQRVRLLRGLGSIAARTGAEVTCVFDGAELGGPVPVPQHKGVRVLFSRPGEIADELIRRLVAAEPQGRPLIVVSSDREVADGVRRSGARPVPSAMLVRALARA
jgi:predicted RNA-binding protein with PIN domain